MQNYPPPAKLPELLNQSCNFEILRDLECPKPVKHSLFYEWLHYILLFGRGSAMKKVEEDGYSISELQITTVFAERRLAFPRSAKKN